MIAEQVTEELFLDYKAADSSTSSRKLSDSDRKNLAKAISGFGNSDGGVVIWGVDCRRDPKTGRETVTKKPIDDPAAFKSLIDGVMGGLTLPGHDGVESLALKFSSGAGIVATYVPEGPNVPYRSVAAGANGYFMRAGSSFFEVPHGVLAGMFGRRPAPKIIGFFRPVAPQKPQTGSPVKINFELVLVNEGRGIATDLFSIVKGKDVPGVLLRRKSLDDGKWIGEHVEGQWIFYTNNSFVRLVPGAQTIPCEFQLEINNESPDPIMLRATCASSNSAGTEFRLNFLSDDLSHIYRNLTHDFKIDRAGLMGALENLKKRMNKAAGIE